LFVQAVLAIAMVVGAFVLLAVLIFAVQVLFAVTGVVPDR
jgi:hypothetical protein